MLHGKTYTCDTDPAAQPHEDWFPAGFYKRYDVRIQSDGTHCHYNEELAQSLQRICDNRRKVEHSSDNRSKDKEQDEEWKDLLQADF